MIISALLDRHERDIERGDALPAGYSRERIGWVFVLDRNGAVLAIENLREGKVMPRLMMPSHNVDRSGSGALPRLYHDKCDYALGVISKAKPTERQLRGLDKLNSAWRELHTSIDSDDAGLRALAAFCGRWQPADLDAFEQADEIRKGDNIAFCLDGDLDDNGRPRLINERPAAHAARKHVKEESDVIEGVCSITGEHGVIARKHPKIKGIIGAQKIGPLVASNMDCGDHFGRAQGYNAQIGEAATHAYASTLNALLASGRNKVRLGNTTLVHWVTGGGDVQTAESLLAALLGGQTVDAGEGEQSATLARAIDALATGRPLPTEINLSAGYQVIALAPADARIVVRWHLSGTLGELAGNVARHWSAMAMEPAAWQAPPTPYRLVMETVPASLRDDRDAAARSLNPTLPDALLRSVVTGAAYPRNLLPLIVQRFATDRQVTPLRVALCKAILMRNYNQEVPVSLDLDNPIPAYQLGRLFAQLERLYALANPGSKRSLSDASLQAMMTRPASTLPRLMQVAQHHIAAIKRDGKGGIAVTIDRDMDAIMSRLPTTIPARLSVTDQASFVIGMRQQRAYRAPKSTENDTSETEQ